jgi:hypothetical protein
MRPAFLRAQPRYFRVRHNHVSWGHHMLPLRELQLKYLPGR